jgi:hypothetical protein
MKRRLLVTLAMAFTIVSLSAVNAIAQNIGKATIPFDFVVNSRLMPSGTYTVIQIDLNVIRLVGSTKTVSTLVNLDRNETRGATPSLVFLKLGPEYFLETVWISATQGVNVPQCSREREALRAISAETDKSVVALR